MANKQVSIGDMMRERVVETAQKATSLGTSAKSAFDGLNNVGDAVTNATENQKRVLKTGSNFLIASTLFIGTTAILDMSMRMAQKNKAELENKRMIKELEEKEKEKKKKADNYQTGVSFGQAPDMGKVAFEMFEQRTGHTRMGNSHFYK